MGIARAGWLAPALMVLPAVSIAQSVQADAIAARTFPCAFYERLRPRTALDMVLQTPGFRIQSGATGRGLDGAVGNILINGTRPPAKAAPVMELLAGIPARDVTAVVLIPAGATEIDMAGHAMLLDVLAVTREGKEGTLAATARNGGPGTYSGSMQADMRSNSPGRLVTMSAQSSHGRTVTEGRSIAPPAGQVAVRRAGGTRSANRSERFSAATHWKPAFGGDVQLRVNASSSDNTSRPFDNGDLASTLQGSGGSHAHGGDVAAEIQLPVADERGTLSISALNSRSHGKSLSRVQGPQGKRDSISRVRQGETAARAVLRWKLSDAWTLQAGADNAWNFMQGELDYRVDGVPVTVPGSENQVEESRGGMLTTVSWHPRGGWSWEAGLRWEASSLARRGDTGSGSRYTELLPRVWGTWQQNPGVRWRGGFERQLGQLGFSQFLATAGLVDDVVTAGAPSLSPESSWRYGLDYEYRFGERGLFSVRAWRKEIDNPIDMVVLDDGLQAMANVAPAVIDTLESQLSAPLDGLGIPGGMLNLSKADSRSSTVDPVTGEARPVSAAPAGASMSLRQDLPSGKGAWGISVSEGAEGSFHGVSQVMQTRSGVSASAFGQWRPRESLVLRLGYSAGRTGRSETWFYDAPRSAGSEADSIFTQVSSTPAAWDARLEWENGDDLRLELGLAWSGTAQYSNHALAPAGETIEHSSLPVHPSLSTNVEWRW